jgi:hypothetical protein
MSEILRERAELHMVKELARIRLFERGERALLKRRSAEDQLADLARQIEALRAIGAFAGQEASAWIARCRSELESAPDEGDVSPSDEAREAMSRLLEELLESSAPERRSGLDRRSVSAFEHALMAFQNVRMLSTDEAARWLERFLAETDISDDEKQTLLRRKRAQFCMGVDLRHVCVGPQAPVGGVRITHLELYDDGTTLNWHRVSPLPEPDARQRDRLGPGVRIGSTSQRPVNPELELRDDLGMRYDRLFGDMRGGWTTRDGLFIQRVSYTYVPAVQADARRLAVSHAGEVVEIPLER